MQVKIQKFEQEIKATVLYLVSIRLGIESHLHRRAIVKANPFKTGCLDFKFLIPNFIFLSLSCLITTENNPEKNNRIIFGVFPQ